MKNLTVKHANIFNGGITGSKININLSNKTTRTANLLFSDLKKFLNKEVTPFDLVNKYFRIEGDNVIYKNPKK